MDVTSRSVDLGVDGRGRVETDAHWMTGGQLSAVS